MAFGNPYGYMQQPVYPTYMSGANATDQMAQMRAPQQYMPQMGGVQMAPPQSAAQQGAPIIWVQGEAGAKSFLVAPGQSVILMDSEAEVFYIKATDATGVPQPLRIFEYKERTTGAQRPAQAAQTGAGEYVTRAEFEALAAKIAGMTAKPAPQEKTDSAPRRRQREVEGMIDA